MRRMNIETGELLAATPPMGWNSWDCYGTTVTEAETLANARFMAEHLLAYGWDTVVVDIQWYEPTARAGGYNDAAPLVLDGYGRPTPALNRFPSAADGVGFTALADQVHALGLKFGLHIMRGIPRLAVAHNLPILGTDYRAADVADLTSPCEWNTDNWGLDHDHVGAQSYYDSLAALFASWGVDFVKADDMLGPYHDAEIAGLATALAKCGRDIVLSLSPGRVLSLAHADHLAEHSHMWRVSDDLWDRWVDVYAQFERLARWAPYIQPGAWPDADMLPLGHIGIRAERGVDRASLLTAVEQRTLMTLWCMARSPLMMGGDLPSSSPETIELLTNADVLAILTSSTGNGQVLRDEDQVLWRALATDGSAEYVAIFHTGDEPATYQVPFGSFGLEVGSVSSATELWSGDAVTATTIPAAVDVAAGTIAVTLPAHGSLLLSLR